MAAIPLLESSRVLQDKVTFSSPVTSSCLKLFWSIRSVDPAHPQISLQKAFRIKRDYVLSRLDKMGLPVPVPPVATFYIWLDLSHLAPPLNNGLVFFEELLKVSPPFP
jgi:aspartate/methionine/tyrosine aminotransferase